MRAGAVASVLVSIGFLAGLPFDRIAGGLVLFLLVALIVFAVKDGGFRQVVSAGKRHSNGVAAPQPNPPLPKPPVFLYAPAICDVRSCPRPHAKDLGGRRQWGRHTRASGAPG